MAELPSGTVTFLFTDIEGSTRLWEEQPEAMRARLAHHDELVRDAIEAHGGRVVKSTATVRLATFATADRRCECGGRPRRWRCRAADVARRRGAAGPDGCARW